MRVVGLRYRFLSAVLALSFSSSISSDPVIENVRDPDVVCANQKYYLTVPFKDKAGGGYQMFRSENLVKWHGPKEVFRRPRETWPGNIFQSNGR